MLGESDAVGSEWRVRSEQPGDLPLAFRTEHCEEAETSFSDSMSYELSGAALST